MSKEAYWASRCPYKVNTELSHEMDDGSEENFLNRLPDENGINPEQALMDKELFLQAQEIFANLPTKQKETVKDYVQGMDYPEIAQKRGVAVGTVKATINQIRENVRKQSAG